MSNKKIPIFILNDQETNDASDIAKSLNESKDYIVVNGNTFCNFPFELSYLRNEWLKVCFEISEKINLPIVINASLVPTSIKNLENAKLFSDIHFIATVSDSNRFEQRYKQLNITKHDWITPARMSNDYLRENAQTEYPEMKVFDISNTSLSEIVAQIDAYIHERIS